MYVGRIHAGEEWTDILEWCPGTVTIDRKGYGVFPVSTMSISVWVNAMAGGRDILCVPLYVCFFPLRFWFDRDSRMTWANGIRAAPRISINLIDCPTMDLQLNASGTNGIDFLVRFIPWDAAAIYDRIMTCKEQTLRYRYVFSKDL